MVAMTTGTGDFDWIEKLTSGAVANEKCHKFYEPVIFFKKLV